MIDMVVNQKKGNRYLVNYSGSFLNSPKISYLFSNTVLGMKDSAIC